MNKNCRRASGRSARFALFRLFACFAYHRMTGSALGMKAFGSSRRFSPPLWCASRSAQLLQKAGHSPSHLPQGWQAGMGLPRAIAALCQRTSQHQQIVRAGHNLRPACGTLRRTQAGLIPEQLLFVKAIAMLLGVAQAIRRADLSQGNRLLALPDKPADPGITRSVAGPMTDDLDHAHFDLPSRAQMQVLPTAHLEARPFGVQPFPAFIRLTVAALVLALKTVSILAAGSQLAWLTGWGGAIEDAIAFDPQQAAGLEVDQARKVRRTSVPAVANNDGMDPTRQQQGHHGAQLAGCHLRSQFPRSDTCGVQNEGALTGLCGQEHHVTEDPARAGRVRVLGQIGDGNQGAILGRLGLGAVQVAGVYSQIHPLPGFWQGREVDKDLAQLLGIDLAVFQRFVQAGPTALKKGRERQFGEAASSHFTAERIQQIEQGIFGLAKAVVHRVTKLVECVKVHVSNAPPLSSFGYITPLSNPCPGVAELLLV